MAVVHQFAQQIRSPVKWNLTLIALVKMPVIDPGSRQFVKFRLADEGAALGVRDIQLAVPRHDLDSANDAVVERGKLLRRNPVLASSRRADPLNPELCEVRP